MLAWKRVFDGEVAALALAGDDVVWIDHGLRRIAATPKAGGETRTLATIGARAGVVRALCATRVAAYWIEKTTLFRVPLSGGAPQKVGAASAGASWLPLVAFDDDAVAFTNGDGIMVSRDGGKPVALIPTTARKDARVRMSRELRVASDRVVWAASGDMHNAESIRTVPLVGGAPSVEIEADRGAAIDTLAVDAGRFAFVLRRTDVTTGNAVSSELHVRATGAPKFLAVATTTAGYASGLLLIGGLAYWYAETRGQGRIVRCALDGGEVETIAEHARATRAFAVDDTHVYAVDFADKRMHLARAQR